MSDPNGVLYPGEQNQLCANFITKSTMCKLYKAEHLSYLGGGFKILTDTSLFSCAYYLIHIAGTIREDEILGPQNSKNKVYSD